MREGFGGKPWNTPQYPVSPYKGGYRVWGFQGLGLFLH